MRPNESQVETAFDPAAWLARYIGLGGGYTVRGQSVWIGWSMDIDQCKQAELCAHVSFLRQDTGRRDLVKAALIGAQAGRA